MRLRSSSGGKAAPAQLLVSEPAPAYTSAHLIMTLCVAILSFIIGKWILWTPTESSQYSLEGGGKNDWGQTNGGDDIWAVLPHTISKCTINSLLFIILFYWSVLYHISLMFY